MKMNFLTVKNSKMQKSRHPKGQKMKKYDQLSATERRELYQELLSQYEKYKEKGLSLDLSRGKPNASQLDVCNGLLRVDLADDFRSESGVDCRNYGVLDGLVEMKRLFADSLGLKTEDIIVGGNSSLQLMYDTLSRAMIFGLYGSPRPWAQETGLKWICVAPGYDRHFRITELLGFELITVKMKEDGPDMDEVERLAKDPKVKGIWCIPKYSNPSGNTYSDEVVRRLVSMECGAPDFRIMWDNAYAIHDFDENGDTLADVFAEAERFGNKDRVLYFASTSKMTYPGGGVALMAMSENNRKQTMKYLGAQTIGFDKINQLRHVRFFGNADNMRKHMLGLGALIKKKFDITLEGLSVLEGLGVATWTKPRGGYFVSLDCVEGTATRVFNLMKEAGVTLTSVGATYPYGVDPFDSNLRIAPTYPTDEELYLAVQILTVAIRLAALEKLGV